MPRSQRSRFVAALLVVFVVTVWYAWRPLVSHFLAFGPTSSGGSRQEIQQQIIFGFDGPLQESNLPKPWQAKVIAGKRDCQIVEALGGQKALQMVCNRSHYVLWYEAVPIDSRRFSSVRWSWKADQLPPRGDSRTHAQLPLIGDNRNDKALQLMIGFEGDLVLNYVWDSNAPVGYEFDERSPVATIKTTVIDSGNPEPGVWRSHKVDVYADFIRRFGKPPGKILGVGLSANTNHTAALGDGTFGPISAVESDLNHAPRPIAHEQPH